MSGFAELTRSVSPGGSRLRDRSVVPGDQRWPIDPEWDQVGGGGADQDLGDAHRCRFLACRRLNTGHALADTLGVADRLAHLPAELSGGQQQRVAMARALITQPDLLFADEPTGNLDSTSSAEVLSQLRRAVRELGQTVVMVTHELEAAAYADDVVIIADGRIHAQLTDPTSDQLVAALTGGNR